MGAGAMTKTESSFYAQMSDLEIVGHVVVIPDASELSQALALRVCRLVEERDKAQRSAADLQRKLLSLQLGIAEDKLDAYVEIVERAA
jgi:hypothetical protein